MHSPARAAVTVGAVLLATTLLSGCAGEKHTFSSKEVSNLDKTIEALDSSWSQHRANGVAATVDPDSHCFVQSAQDGTLAANAICGPVRYLGQDAITWDSVGLKASPDGTDKVTLAGSDSFSPNAQPGANTKLYRTDGKNAKTDANLAEPDTKAASPEQALWDSSYQPPAAHTSASPKTATVKTPDGSIDVTAAAVADRVGGASNRLKAGDGNKFAVVSLTTTIGQSSSTGWGSASAATQPKTTLAFVTGGKTYPIGVAKSGTVAMAVPGDGKDLALAVIYNGMTQTVTLADSQIHTTATAYYDGYADKSGPIPNPADLSIGSSQAPGWYASFGASNLAATRTAYDEKAGWAPEGKAWLKITGTISNPGTIWEGYPTHGLTSELYPSGYHTKIGIPTATVTNVSGAAFSADVKSVTDVQYSDAQTMLFEVPATVGDFNLSFTAHASGKRASSGSDAAPATADLDYPVKNVQISFPKN